MNNKFILITTLLALLTLLLGFGPISCQRNNMPYGGVKEDTTKLPYTEQVNLNNQNIQK